MKLIHVTTLVTPEGSFGGPVRVAVNQVRELREAGHDAILAASCLGYGRNRPTEHDGVPIMLFPAQRLIPSTGFAGLVSIGLYRWLRGQMDCVDVIHMHLARDLVTLPAAGLARRCRTPFVIQPHGMIDPSSNRLAAPLDAALTIPLLRAASTVFHLTPKERVDLTAVAGQSLSFEKLENGIPRAASPSPLQSTSNVLFLARLHPRKRPELFARASMGLKEAFPTWSFSIAGPDEGSLRAVSEILAGQPSIETSVRVEGAIDPEMTLGRITGCDLFVLPSVDEPFPMGVLEAMSLGKPVIVTDSCGLAPFIRSAEAGVVVGPSESELVSAMRRLMSDGAERERLGSNGRKLVESRFSMSGVRMQLEAAYERAIARTADRGAAVNEP